MNRSGGLRAMATVRASRSMSVTTPPIGTPMGAAANYSAAREKKLCCAPRPEMPALFGENSSTTVGNGGSTVPSSATRRRRNIEAASSFRRRMRLLTASGLVRGITPTSTRHGLPQGTLDGVFSSQDGDGAGARKAVS